MFREYIKVRLQHKFNVKFKKFDMCKVYLFLRLEKCEVCLGKKAIYTCPKCEVRTCSLDCVRTHKKELSCNGIRDKTKYIPKDKITDLDFSNGKKCLQKI